MIICWWLSAIQKKRNPKKQRFFLLIPTYLLFSCVRVSLLCNRWHYSPAAVFFSLSSRLIKLPRTKNIKSSLLRQSRKPDTILFLLSRLSGSKLRHGFEVFAVWLFSTWRWQIWTSRSLRTQVHLCPCLLYLHIVLFLYVGRKKNSPSVSFSEWTKKEKRMTLFNKRENS